MELDDLLKSLRHQIDTIDEEMIYLLSRRFECVKQIGNLKKELGMQKLQPERWEKLLENLYAEAMDKGVNKKFITQMWNCIHEESLRIEE